MTQPPIEDRVAQLLREAASQVTPTRDPLAAFRNQTARQARRHWRSFPVLHSVQPFIAIAVVIALFAATFALVQRPGANGPSTTSLPKGLHVYTPTPFPTPQTPYPTQNPGPSPTPVKHIQLRRDQIKLSVIQAYAFPTRTGIWVRAEYDAALGGGLDLPEGTLTGPPGYSSFANGGDWGHTTTPGAKTWTWDWHLYADPLPGEALKQPQNMTLTLVLSVFSLNANQDFREVIDGTWPVTFAVTPQVATTRSYTVAPVTRAGITIRPISWESSPTTQQFDDYTQAGGRLIIDMHGFPDHSYLESVGSFKSDSNSPWSSSGGESSLTMEDDFPIKESILSVNGNPPPTQEAGKFTFHEIGPKDVVRVSVVFYQQFVTNRATVTLLINDLHFRGQGNTLPESSVYIADGPWQFTLPWP